MHAEARSSIQVSGPAGVRRRGRLQVRRSTTRGIARWTCAAGQAGWVGLLLALAGVLLLGPSGCRPPSQTASEAGTAAARPAQAGVPVVRVRLLSDESSVRLSATANPSFATTGALQDKVLNIAGRSIELRLAEGSWVFGATPVSGGVLTLTPAADGTLAVNGQTYRGKLRFVPTSGNRFDVVNEVDVDAYLKSVVSRELLRDWHPETFRAQAIVARTYALYEVATAGANRYWDVFPDERSQVYGGMSAESQRSVEAVSATRGIVMAFGPPGDERIFKAYFASTCGGIGQSAQDAFNDPPIPPLIEKNAGTLCSASPRFTWGPVTLSKAEVTRRIRAWGQRRDRAERNIAEVRAIQPSHHNRFGRPVRFLVTDSRGTRYSLLAEELRWAINGSLNTRTLWSSFINVQDTGAAFVFTGRGSGHGVGMCQYCAESLARRGLRHEEIIRFSYPGVRLVRAY